MFFQVRLGLRNGISSEMENTCGKHGIRFPFPEDLFQMFQSARPALSNHRHIHGFGNRPGQRTVVTVFRTVRIHAGQQDFPCSQ